MATFMARRFVLMSFLAMVPAASPAQTPTVPVLSPAHTVPLRKHPAQAKPAHGKHPPARPPVKEAAKPLPKPPPAPPLPANIGSVTGLKLPRYVSLKTDLVNMRSGPGERYPVLWVYRRREMPVKIEREFDIWRLVEDMDGTKGWMHEATLTSRRGFIVTGTDPRIMRADASDTADAVAVLKPGVIGRLRSCDKDAAWCQVQVQDYRGWLKRTDFWGADADEVVQP
jgi:SH3-like domain-containing protein